ncbi:MAG: hypothetical protein Q9187_002406 [Circinaria calcarea]
MAVGEFPLRDKIVVVTGGGSGISLAFAQLAAARNNQVIIADLRLTDEAEGFLRTACKTSERVIFTRCDVTVWADLQNLISVSENEFGDVPDVYIAGAGIFERTDTSYWFDTESERYACIDINASHPIKLTRIATRALLNKNKHGVVLIISSSAGLYPVYPTPLYNASKHAVVGFVKSMKPADDEEDIKIVCICPAYTATPLWTPDLKEQWPVPDALALTAHSVAEAMMSLVQESKYPGGTIMSMSGYDGIKVVEFEDYWKLFAPLIDSSCTSLRKILGDERG